MNEGQDQEDELNLWLLDSSQAALIQQAIESVASEVGKVPGEQWIEDKIVESTLAKQTNINALETRLRQWQVATALAVVACAVMACFLILPNRNTQHAVSVVPVSVSSPVSKPALFSADISRVSSVRPKLSKTQKKLMAISARTKSRRYRDFSL